MVFRSAAWRRSIRSRAALFPLAASASTFRAASAACVPTSRSMLSRRACRQLADALFRDIPAGVGEEGEIKLSPAKLDQVLLGGAQWAVAHGYGSAADLAYVEEHG